MFLVIFGCYGILNTKCKSVFTYLCDSIGNCNVCDIRILESTLPYICYI